MQHSNTFPEPKSTLIHVTRVEVETGQNTFDAVPTFKRNEGLIFLQHSLNVCVNDDKTYTGSSKRLQILVKM